MAERPAFYLDHRRVVSKSYSFEWFPGFSRSQKQKSIASLHAAIRRWNPNACPLEVSTKSPDVLGVKLSAFTLRLNGHTLENVFQSAKVFERGGPYLDLLDVPPKAAKRDERLRTSGRLTAFRYQGVDFPLEPRTLFYDYIYLSAVKESLSKPEIEQIAQYNCFTDIEFNPAKSLNTQARTAALLRLLLDEYQCLPDFSRDSFMRWSKEHVTE